MSFELEDATLIADERVERAREVGRQSHER